MNVFVSTPYFNVCGARDRLRVYTCVCVHQTESVYDRVCSAFDDGAALFSVVKLNREGVNCLK